MSAVALPPPKPAGARPPILPPITTTFDGAGDGGGEPYHKLVAESVRQLMKAIKNAAPSQLFVLRELIDQRKRLIERELAFERMMQPEQPLPPLLSNMYALDFLGQEEEPVKLYTKLLNQLDDAAAKLDRAISELKREDLASEL